MNNEALEQSIEDLQKRLDRIEKKLNLNLVQKKVSYSPSSSALSGNLLGIVSSICFVLAAALIIKLSLDSGWLTHEKQLSFATLLGLTLFAAGLLISSTDKFYASFLPAAGSAILYFTCFAAYQFYYLITFQTVIALTCIITSLSLWFYIQFKHDIYAIIAAIGAYSAPFVSNLSNIDANIIFILYYFIICSLTFATLSIWVTSRTLTLISSYLAIAITALVGLHLNMNGLFSAALAIYFLIFSLGTYCYTQLTRNALTEKEAWSFFPVLLLFYAMEYYFISRIEPTLASLVSLASAALLVSLTLWAKKWSLDKRLHSNSVVVTFATLVFFHSFYLELLPHWLKPWLFILIILTASFVKEQKHLQLFDNVMIVPIIAIALILGIEYLDMLNHLGRTFTLYWAVVSWCYFFSLWFFIIAQEQFLTQNKNYYYFILAATHFLGIMSLYQLALGHGSLAITASWSIYALLVLCYAYFKHNLDMAKSVLIILSFIMGKALLFDAITTPNLIRTLSLILTGIVLYASGLILRKMLFPGYQSNQKNNSREKK